MIEQDEIKTVTQSSGETVEGLYERTKQLADRIHGVAMQDGLSQLFYVSTPRDAESNEVGLSFGRNELPNLIETLEAVIVKLKSLEHSGWTVQ